MISPSNPGTPQNACILRGAPFGLSSPCLKRGVVFRHGSKIKPPPAGSPQNHSPRRGPTVLGGTFGARAWGRPRTAPPRRRHVMPLAMRPLRDRKPHRKYLWRIADALPSSPRHSHGRRRLSRGGKPPVKVWLGGSTSNKRASYLRTARSSCSLDRLRKRTIVFKHAPNKITSCQVTLARGFR